MIEIIATITHRARKTHQCDSCRKNIKKGQLYERGVYKYKKSAYTWKQCNICNWLVNNVYEEIDPYQEGYSMGELLQFHDLAPKNIDMM